MDIKQISKQEAMILISNYHYLGKKGFRSAVIYGLIDGKDIVGACVFHGVSAPETVVGAFGLDRNNQDGFWELGRLVMHPSLNGGNTTSWFVSRCIKQLQKEGAVRAIISYADSSAGHTGSIYRACNALYCGFTKPKNDYWVDGKIKERGKTTGVAGEWKPRPQKLRYVWIFDKNVRLLWPVVSYNKSGVPKWLQKCITCVEG